MSANGIRGGGRGGGVKREGWMVAKRGGESLMTECYREKILVQYSKFPGQWRSIYTVVSLSLFSLLHDALQVCAQQ